MGKTTVWLMASILGVAALALASCAPPAPATAPPPATNPAPAPLPAPTPAQQPGPAEPTPPFDRPTISPVPGLTAARDLVGTWRGTGVYYWVEQGTGARSIKVTNAVTLIITQQNGNAVTGTITNIKTKQENLVPNNFNVPDYGPTAIQNGVISSTSLYFEADGDRWEFTFTTDLMSGQFTTPGLVGVSDPKSFVLSRQR